MKQGSVSAFRQAAELPDPELPDDDGEALTCSECGGDLAGGEMSKRTQTVGYAETRYWQIHALGVTCPKCRHWEQLE